MRDVPLYEHPGGMLSTARLPLAQPVPAVVGVTVAEVKQEYQAGWQEGIAEGKEERDALRRERDEARAERDNLSTEAHHWMREAARCREALERQR